MILAGLNRVFLAYLIGSIALLSSQIFAEPIWQSQFEDNSLSKWSYLLHPHGIQISSQHAACGKSAALITVKGDEDYWWHNNPALNRVEMQYSPDSVQPGNQTVFSWYFMLPEPLGEGIHQIGYWESNKTYQQIMRVEVQSSQLRFYHTLGQTYLGDAISINPGQWYQVSMQVGWHHQSSLGNIAVWLDRQPWIQEGTLQTLVSSEERAFVQIGLLRHAAAQDAKIWIDSAQETLTFEQASQSCNDVE